jgi:hypothetical protein
MAARSEGEGKRRMEGYAHRHLSFPSSRNPQDYANNVRGIELEGDVVIETKIHLPVSDAAHLRS